MWLIHSRRQNRGPARQLVLPVAAALILVRTAAGHAAVPAAGAVAAATVAVGVTLTARQGAAPEEE
ncbi:MULTISPECIES: hypothetical protein [unclassified Streptomyces]|uniref:hypothetical protein n=1 Tax=unclassified Streptomyces TaxID=2593676 RepID=UPI00344B93CC